MLNEEFVKILACPRCDDRPPLRQEEGRLICDKCRHAYPVVDGIPHLVVEEATPLDQPTPENKS